MRTQCWLGEMGCSAEAGTGDPGPSSMGLPDGRDGSTVQAPLSVAGDGAVPPRPGRWSFVFLSGSPAALKVCSGALQTGSANLLRREVSMRRMGVPQHHQPGVDESIPGEQML